MTKNPPSNNPHNPRLIKLKHTPQIPRTIEKILHILRLHGFSAFVIGGCVRDCLLHKRPKDWDIATNATPKQICKVFANRRDFFSLEIGAQFGCIGLVEKKSKKMIEVTTFRVEREYQKFRKPQDVIFGTRLSEDVQRRDFRINALAFDENLRVMDYVGGLQDLKKRQIACIGEPKERLSEDSLRILRALRFCACLGFTIHTHTRDALFACASLMLHLSSERIKSELDKLLLGENSHKVLVEFDGIFKIIFLDFCKLTQNYLSSQLKDSPLFNPRALALLPRLPKKLELRWVALLYAFTMAQNISQKQAHENAKQILSALKSPKKFSEEVLSLFSAFLHFCTLQTSHSKVLSDIKLKRIFCTVKRESLESFFTLVRAKEPKLKRESLRALSAVLNVKELKINGNDIKSLDVSDGAHIGRILCQLLESVLKNEVPNTHNALLQRAKILKETL
ncbi:CCA tRNA nucleotidyltransferase [Helicobacter himalayensis]|uniref:CCA tRNA nucleotidyltransferase n=1 Tax=Helicobacter himalayensis TaxID=1591088 RepID=UPI003D6DCC7B